MADKDTVTPCTHGTECVAAQPASGPATSPNTGSNAKRAGARKKPAAARHAARPTVNARKGAHADATPKATRTCSGDDNDGARSNPVSNHAPVAPAPTAHVVEDTRRRIEPMRFRTRLCRHYVETGVCPFDPNCAFAHGEHELRTLKDNIVATTPCENTDARQPAQAVPHAVHSVTRTNDPYAVPPACNAASTDVVCHGPCCAASQPAPHPCSCADCTAYAGHVYGSHYNAQYAMQYGAHYSAPQYGPGYGYGSLPAAAAHTAPESRAPCYSVTTAHAPTHTHAANAWAPNAPYLQPAVYDAPRATPDVNVYPVTTLEPPYAPAANAGYANPSYQQAPPATAYPYAPKPVVAPQAPYVPNPNAAIP